VAVTAVAGGAADIIRLAGAEGARSVGAAIVARQDIGRRVGAEQAKASYMIAYRFYQLDLNNRLDGPPRVMECEDDDAALVQALRYVDGHAIEIWRDDKRIALVPAMG